MMNRRDALKNVAILMGGTVVGAQAFLSGCKSADRSVNDLFFESEIDLLDEIAETIIPTTDTPGAKDAKVGSFMAMMVVDCYEEKDQKSFKEGLDKIKSSFKDKYNKEFIKGSKEEKKEFLTLLDEEQKSFMNLKTPDQHAHYFRMMKELTLLGYFSSEIGSTQALRYVEVPGRYDACIPYTKGDKAWAI
jgi:hypothetical protein